MRGPGWETGCSVWVVPHASPSPQDFRAEGTRVELESPFCFLTNSHRAWACLLGQRLGHCQLELHPARRGRPSGAWVGERGPGPTAPRLHRVAHWLLGVEGPQGSGGCGSGTQTPQTSAPVGCRSQKTPPTKSPPCGWKPGRPRVTPTPLGPSEAARSRAVGTGLAFPLQPWGPPAGPRSLAALWGPRRGRREAGGRQCGVGTSRGPADSGQSAPRRPPHAPALPRGARRTGAPARAP